jgi:hypothetical protein
VAIPNPEPGLVVSYVYLWHYERKAGRDEGRKDRPGLIVLVEAAGQDQLVTILPFSTVEPEPGTAIEVPEAVRRHLGLDAERSWVIVNEGNEFIWAGYDLRQIPRTGEYAYGFVPPRFFNQVVAAFAAWHKTGRMKRVLRDE